MNKILVLITTSFPYGKLEPFIESELDYYTNFDKVLCMSIHKTGEPREINYPENFLFCNVDDYKFKRDIKYIPKLLLKKKFWSEILNLLKSSRFSIRNIHHLISVGIQSEHYCNCLKNEIDRFERSNGGNNKYIFYSYWMVEHAMCGVALKQYYKDSVNVTRTHRYDLYEYRDKGKYIPFRKYILDNTDLVLPISIDGFEYLNLMYGKRDNIQLSRLGTKDYGISEYTKTDYDLTIVSCSWCTEVKRIDLIIKTLSKIKNKRIRWIHFGDGYLYESLKTLANEVLPSNIEYTFKGAVTNAEILDFYKNNSIDVFLNVSASEGIPVSIMEIQSFGIPVIATDVGGVKEIITHGENGYLLPKDFYNEELIRLIEFFIEMSKEAKEKMRKTSRAMWQNHYSAANNYMKLFRKISEL